VVDQGAQRRVETQTVGAPPVVTEDELGDLLLEAVRAGSAHGLDPEQALRKAVRRFQSRVMQERPGGDLD
jgi:hypothetical protein